MTRHISNTPSNPAGGPRPFLSDRRGAIAPMAAVVLGLVVAPTTAGLLDVSRAMSSQNNLQDALDSTALALAHLPQGTSTDAMQSMAQQWLTANLHDRNISGVTLAITSSTGQLDLSANGTVQTSVGGIIGLSQVPVEAHSTAKWGIGHIELALVLDNTGSMSADNKLTSLQSAASSLVDTLSPQNNNDPNAVKISVVPFSMTVNIGSQYRGQSWLVGTQPAGYGSDLFTSGADRFALFDAMKQGSKQVTWGGCVESRPDPYDVQDTAPSSADSKSLFVPYFAPDEPDYVSYNSRRGTTSGSYANSYVSDGYAVGTGTWSDRQGATAKYSTTSVATGTSSVTGFKMGPNAGCEIAPLLRLTNDMTTVKTKLNAMVASGDTNIPMGLMWGWHALSPNAPFADGAAYGTQNTSKIVVLVTDGANHYLTGSSIPGNNGSLYEGIGYVWQNRVANLDASASDGAQPAIDSRLTKLCSNMKAQGIIIYTVPVEVTDTNIKTLLQNCASSADKYIDVASSNQLSAAFGNIAGSISKLRISQ